MRDVDIEKVIFSIQLIKSLLEINRKIQAIKLIMLLYKTDLRQAKELVESIQNP